MSSAVNDVSDRFDVKETLGVGAMGVVERAYDRIRRIDVAVKNLRRLDGRTLYHFKREFRSLTGLVHRNLLTLYELHCLHDGWSLSMELIDGVSFLEHVRPHGHLVAGDGGGDDATASLAANTSPTATLEPGAGGARARPPSRWRTALRQAAVDLPRLRSSLRQLAEGVQALHDAGMLHRDIKPSNVLVEHGGRVVVCDFGLVVDADNDSERELLGTPNYMSPEQAMATRTSAASDWYSVGVVLFEALTGRLPFEGGVRDVIAAKLQTDPVRPSDLDPQVPDDLDELCHALLQRSPEARPTGAEVLAALGSGAGDASRSRAARFVGSSVFVGRDEQLGELRRAMADSRDGHCVSVFVGGRSGIGKTALVREFLGELERHGSPVILEGRCYERESVPYKALDAMVDALTVRLLELDELSRRSLVPDGMAALARVFPVVGRLGGTGGDEPADAQELRQRAFNGLFELVRRVARSAPMVVFIDDLQWGDLDSAPFLTRLIHDSAQLPLLFVASYRADEADSSPLLQAVFRHDSPAGRGGDVRHIDLAPLGRSAALELALSYAADADESARVRVAASVQDAKGSPMFISELARAALEGGGDVDDATPPRLDDVLHRRVADLPKEARDLLTAAAVAGRPVRLEIVARASGIRNEPGALARLQADHLVRVRRAGDRELVETYHDRIRQSLVARLSPDSASAVHGRLATELERAGDDDPQSLVEHWLGAGEPARAGDYARQAAAAAARALAFERAAHYYGLVLELCELDDTSRRAVGAQRGDALVNAGSLVEAAEAYLAAAAAGPPDDDAVDLERRAMEQLLRRGKFAEGMALAERVVAAVGMRLPRGRANAIATILVNRARLKLRGRRLGTPAVIDESQLRKMRVGWSVCTGLGLINPILGTAMQTGYVLSALNLGDPTWAALSMCLEMAFVSTAGGKKRAQVDRIWSQCDELADRSDDPMCRGVSTCYRGLIAFLRGDWAEAATRLSIGQRYVLEHCTGVRYELDVARHYHMASLVYLGRIGELTRTMPALLREAHAQGDEYLATGLRSWRSNVMWLMLDQPDEARRHTQDMDEVRAFAEGFHLHHYFSLLANGQIDLYLGAGANAFAHVDRYWPELAGSLLLRIQSVRIESHFLRARCALAAVAQGAGDAGALIKIATRSVAAIAREGEPWGDAIAELLRAGVAAARDNADDAIEHLQTAERLCSAAEMMLLANACKARRGAAMGGDLGAAVVADAEAWMRGEAIVDPAAVTRLYLPWPRGRLGDAP